MTLRRRCSGAKRITEDADSYLCMSGRGAFQQGRRWIVRTAGLVGSEKAGMRSARGMRIPTTVCLRVSGEGSSSQSESGPKVRPKGVVDGLRVDIPVLPI